MSPKSLRLATLSLLASLGCSSTPAVQPAVVDAGGAEDVTDVPVPRDVPVGPDVLFQFDVPVVITPADPDAALPDVPAATDAATRVDAGPLACAISAEVPAFLQELAANSWATQHRARATMMYGCAGASGPRGCLASLPLAGAADIGADRSAVAGASLRVLYTTMMSSYYWTRSSADGRFIARGVKIRDMVRGVDIDAAGARVDPAFFPDNSGFMYQPSGRLCPQSALSTGAPTAVQVIGDGSPCANTSVGLYEHLAVALNGNDYWASSAGNAAWDNGGFGATLTETPRNQPWLANAQLVLSLMANTGAGFRYVASRNITTPFQGDAVISPSSRAMITRFVDGDGAYQGYVLHRITATQANGAISASTQELARYCMAGAKPAWSFDERYIVFHHYLGGGAAADLDAREMGFTDARDPGFAEYARRGAADIYLLDLGTGRRTRVTRMAAGQYALFPHFRADGWIYFLVRTPGTTRESVIASDAALVLP